MPQTSKTIRAMGTDVTICIVTSDHYGAKKDIKDVEKDINIFEKKFSRFLKDSELSKLNSSGGENIKISKEMMELLKKAKEMNELTNGIFDPTVIGSLEMYGYDKSLDFSSDISIEKNISEEDIKESFSKRARFEDIVLDEKNCAAKMPSGMRMDFGGLGKGYIVDILTKEILKKYGNFWISAGGDMFLFGHDESGSLWNVGLQDPNDLDKDIASLNVIGGEMAVATSGVTKRKGHSGSLEWNHIIDPRTGLSISNNILMVTVIAKSVSEADVFAKTALILGEKSGVEFINKIEGAECVMINKEGKMILSDGMKKYISK